jgi:predicted nucleotidyltransferase component of viral defense system
MLHLEQHRLILQQLLKDIFSHPGLAAQLIFKGGTCLYLFYGLDRFSTDLDFDLRTPQKKPDLTALQQIITKYLKLEDAKEKRFTYYYQGSYHQGWQKVKIEINRRFFPNGFQLTNYFGLSVATMLPEYMLAHKLCAITDRPQLQNRDLYDANFMFQQNWQPNAELIQFRTGLSVPEY